MELNVAGAKQEILTNGQMLSAYCFFKHISTMAGELGALMKETLSLIAPTIQFAAADSLRYVMDH